ncbi:MAG: B-box zinc finger protein [Longilinea sp.]|nr:B-box zinc finger protein [Longilinea sp.]
MTENSGEPLVMHCVNHPDRETLLRCNRCEQPICSQCAVLTPTGYRCKRCVNNQQRVFDTAKTSDYFVAFFAAGILSFIGSFSAAIGFFTIFLAPIIGVIVSEAVRWLTRRRRSKALSQLTTAAAGLGSLPLVLTSLINLLMFLSSGQTFSFGYIWPLLWYGAYTFLVCSTVYYRMSGIQIR